VSSLRVASSAAGAQSGLVAPTLEAPRSPAFIFSVDVEDWFHILDLRDGPPRDSWPSLPSRVEQNLHRVLDLLDEHRTTVTMFFLGWIAERFPHLVREAQARGHEIASHSHAHRLVYSMSPAEFIADARRARAVLQDISGEPVAGFRAPGFSVTAATPWFFEALLEVGHSYDCSVFPAPRGHGGYPMAERAPHVVSSSGGALLELPASVATVLGRRICFFGGGYLRLFPAGIICAMTKRVHAEKLPVIFYLHPRDIDPDQPRLPMPALRSFKCYAGLGTTYAKLQILLNTFPFISVREYLAATATTAPVRSR
jgi:polysaccharide deacetylase family protein (PEP-CTERM system associated)